MRLLGFLALLVAFSAHARYPVKPVHLIVPFPPSGGNDVFARITAARDYKVRVDLEGAVVLEGTPAEFAALIKAQSERWGKLIRAAGIKPE